MCVNLIAGTTTDTINSFHVWSITSARHFSSSCDFWKTIRGVTSPGRLRGSTVREFSCPLPQIKKILQEMRLAYRSNSYFIAFEIVRTYLRYRRKTIRTIATRRINSTKQCCTVHCYCFIIFFTSYRRAKNYEVSRKALWIQKSSLPSCYIDFLENLCSVSRYCTFPSATIVFICRADDDENALKIPCYTAMCLVRSKFLTNISLLVKA